MPIASAHSCLCEEEVHPNGHHGLSYKKSASRLTRHHNVNNIIVRYLGKEGVPAILDPLGVLHDEGKRLDTTTLIPWAQGKAFFWDPRSRHARSLAPSKNLNF